MCQNNKVKYSSIKGSMLKLLHTSGKSLSFNQFLQKNIHLEEEYECLVA